MLFMLLLSLALVAVWNVAPREPRWPVIAIGRGALERQADMKERPFQPSHEISQVVRADSSEKEVRHFYLIANGEEPRSDSGR